MVVERLMEAAGVSPGSRPEGMWAPLGMSVRCCAPFCKRLCGCVM